MIVLYTLLAGGVLFFGSKVVRLLLWIWTYFLRPNTDVRKYCPRGSWAVITGASDGIGRAFAEELARAGVNVALISRTESKLKDVVDLIHQKFEVQCKYLVVNFASPDHEKLWEAVREFLHPLEVSLLVNNVAVNLSLPTPFEECQSELLDSCVTVNISTLMQMTQLVLPGMLDRRNGTIINLSSLSAVHGSPYLAVYAASKAFVDSFSCSLNMEVAHRGVRVVSVLPSFVVSNMSKIRRASLMVPTPKVCARECLGMLGLEPSVIPHWTHSVLGWAMDTVPFPLLRRLMVSHMLSTRQRALKKQKREKEKAT